MYKDTKKKDKKIKLLATIFIIIIFVLMIIVFIFEVNKKVEYKDIWGEEKSTEYVEYIEEELHPTIQNADNYNIINQTIENSYELSEETQIKNRRSGYYDVDIDIPTLSIAKRYIDTEHTIPTPSNANIKDVPNYHTGRIFYKDLNSE